MALETRPYGKTGDHAAVLGLGGTSLNKHSFEMGVSTVHRALELGVTYFDTSPLYGNGMSQAILGEALQGRSEEYVLATKVGHMGSPARFRSYDALRAQFDENLRLLRRDSVDTLQSHESDWPQWWTDLHRNREAARSVPTTTSGALRSWMSCMMPKRRVCAVSTESPATPSKAWRAS